MIRVRKPVALHYCLHQEPDPIGPSQPANPWQGGHRESGMRPRKWQLRGEDKRSSSVETDGGLFHVRDASIQSPYRHTAKVHRREFLCLAPSAALASSIPLGVTSPRPSGNQVSIREALAALWDHSEEGSGSIIKPSTAERIESFISGCNVGLISCLTIRPYDGCEPRPMRKALGLHLAPVRLHRRRCPL